MPPAYCSWPPGGTQVGAYGQAARAKMCRRVQKVAEMFGGFKKNAYLCIVQDKTPWRDET